MRLTRSRGRESQTNKRNDLVSCQRSTCSQLRDELLSGLDPADQQLMKLLIEGYTLPEISSRLELSYSNAAVRLHRLRQTLRKYMQDKGL